MCTSVYTRFEAHAKATLVFRGCQPRKTKKSKDKRKCKKTHRHNQEKGRKKTKKGKGEEAVPRVAPRAPQAGDTAGLVQFNSCLPALPISGIVTGLSQLEAWVHHAYQRKIINEHDVAKFCLSFSTIE